MALLLRGGVEWGGNIQWSGVVEEKWNDNGMAKKRVPDVTLHQQIMVLIRLSYVRNTLVLNILRKVIYVCGGCGGE